MSQLRKIKPAYSTLISHLQKAWKIIPVTDDPFWYAGSASRQTLDSKNLRCVIWNICKGVGGHYFHHDFRQLAYQSDLMLLQEALLSQRLLSAFCEPGFQLLHAASYMRQDRIRDGVLTACRSRLHEPPLRIFCKYPEPIFRTPKVALVTHFPLKNRTHTLRVINVHATLVRSTKRAAEELHHLMDQLPPHCGPSILAGDFNTFTPTYLQMIVSVLETYGFRMIDIPHDPRYWYDHLDHVFVNGVQINNVQVLADIKSSDHFPVYVCATVVE